MTQMYAVAQLPGVFRTQRVATAPDSPVAHDNRDGRSEWFCYTTVRVSPTSGFAAGASARVVAGDNAGRMGAQATSYCGILWGRRDGDGDPYFLWMKGE